MPELILLMLCAALVRLAATRLCLRKQPAPEPLCAGCCFAHIQQAANGRRAISCTYGGDVRPVAINVLYCTDYRNRNAPVLVKTVGFALPLAEDELLAEVATAGQEKPAVVTRVTLCPRAGSSACMTSGRRLRRRLPARRLPSAAGPCIKAWTGQAGVANDERPTTND